MIQRCQVHKKRNVADHHLPDDMKRNAGRTISAAYQSGNAVRAKRMLEALARQLERKHPSAAPSLRERLEETLTVMGSTFTRASRERSQPPTQSSFSTDAFVGTLPSSQRVRTTGIRPLDVQASGARRR